MRGAAVGVQRIASLDQFRGYTVLGMLVVNFLGRYEAVPAVLKHHNTYCSYADTIMPQFFFAVGFAYRLTLLKGIRDLGRLGAYAKVLRRNAALILFGVLFYGLDGGAGTWEELARVGFWGFMTTAFQRVPFQALVHIGLTSLWVMPVMGAGPAWRFGFGVASAGLYAYLSQRFYFEWAWNRPVIDGGPLGFLSWALPLLAGSLAFDAWARFGPRWGALWIFAAGCVGMLVGQWLTALGGEGLAPLPFIAPGSERGVGMWMMSQRTGSVSYLLFSAGFSALVYVVFLVCCDLRNWRVGLFRTFGTNPLVAYVLHGMVDAGMSGWIPRDSPPWFVLTALVIYLILCWLFVRHLERSGVFVRM